MKIPFRMVQVVFLFWMSLLTYLAFSLEPKLAMIIGSSACGLGFFNLRPRPE